MVIDREWAKLFGAGVATWLGFAVWGNQVTRGVLHDGWTDESTIALGGFLLAVCGLLVSFAVAVKGVRTGRMSNRAVLAAVALSSVAAWFWLVPARHAYFAGVCTQKNSFAGCRAAAAVGGAARAVALRNEAWVANECTVLNRTEYCREAAVRGYLRRSEVCSSVHSHEIGQVVEWCGISLNGRVVPRF